MFDKARRIYTMIAVILLNLLIFFVVVEGASVAVRYLYGHFSQSDRQEERLYKYDPRENLTYYQEREWGIDYWKESAQQARAYQPYVGFKRVPFNGDWINVDDSGLRATPGCDERNESLLIFCFGGSAMWGEGSPDNGTIPAHLAEIIKVRFDLESVGVVNFGEVSWISSQEVIQFIQELKQGNVPDIAIFYDGANETGFAYMYGQADIPTLLPTQAPVAKETQFERLIELCSNLNSVRVVIGGLRTVFGYQEPEITEQGAVLEMSIDELSRDVVSTYLHNIDIVDALSKQYGFDYYFLWQPSLYSLYEESKPLTPEEQEIKQNLVARSHDEAPGLIQLRQATYGLVKIEATKRNHLYYIADIFNNTEDFIYIDGAHVTPKGNRIIADKIADLIAPSIIGMGNEAR